MADKQQNGRPGRQDGKDAKQQQRLQIRIRPPSEEHPNKLRRTTAFNVNVRYLNALPEVPTDPKMLLPPFDSAGLAAFGLTSLERELKRDMLFEPDLGIPLTPWDVERYEAPDAPPPLHPADEALLKGADAAASGKPRAAAAPEVSWLLRTKYITAAAGEARRPAVAAERLGPAAEAAAWPSDREGQLAVIEAQFEAAQAAPVHAQRPELTPLEVLPVLPDELLAGRQCVLAAFDSDPLGDVSRLRGAPLADASAASQTMQLKSFAQRRPDGEVDRFVALLLPSEPPAAEAGGGEAGARGADGSRVTAEALQGDYEWVREYDSAVTNDPKSSTYLLRLAGDHVGFHDLNTRLALRRRTRQAAEGTTFLAPEKVTLRLPGTAVDMEAEQGEGGAAGSPGAGAAKAAAGEAAPQAGSPEAPAADSGEAGGGAGQFGDAGMGAVMRSVFGSDDDD